jgi:hypothetical protein
VGQRKRVTGRLRLASGVVLATVSVVLLVGAPAAASGAATTFTVSGFGDGAGSCASTHDASGNVVCTTLRAAVNRANLQANSPTIELSAGTYQLTAGNGGQLDLATSMNITGTGPGGPGGTTIQQTDGQNRVLEVDGTSKLSGLEITGGHYSPGWSSGATTYGGGILVVGTLALENSLVTGNQAIGAAGPGNGDPGDSAAGGGIDYGSTASAGSTITDSTISGNTAAAGRGATGGQSGGSADGGGIAYQGSGPLVIQNSTISSNAATGGPGGGGVSNGGAGGLAQGGGIFNGSGLTLTGTTLAANTAAGGAQGPGPASSATKGGNGDGGGIETVGAADTLVNTTVFGNLAQGGSGSTTAAAGFGVAGGLGLTGSGGLVLASDTFDLNRADHDTSIFADVPTPPTGFAIHDTILAVGAPTNAANCEFFPPSQPITDESGNLEDDSAGTCGFKAANHDLVGANPLLPPAPADNGGPTQTLAPAPASPVLGAGGQCLNPTSTPANQPLTVDQRSQPRPNPCDIGAFQAQDPTNTTLPSISGVPLAGRVLSCALGLWSGDGPLSFTYQWLRDGGAISGAASSTYTITGADVGHRLACAVTATHYGSVSATSGSVSVVPVPLLVLLKASVSGQMIVLKLGCVGAPGQVCGGLLKVVTVETIRGRRVVGLTAGKRRGSRSRTVALAMKGFVVPAGGAITLRFRLIASSVKLLKQFHRLPVRLTLNQSTARGTQTVASPALTLYVRPVKRRRHHR